MKSLFCLIGLAVPALGAISFSLPGISESASWTLTSALHPGFNTFGTAANPWASAVTSDAGTASVVLSKISDPLISMVLNYNGGSQALPADFSVVIAGSGYPDRAWQWDLSAVSSITSYEILYSGHHAANSLSVTTGDTFVQVIPEPSMSLLGAAALAFTLIPRRRA